MEWKSRHQWWPFINKCEWSPDRIKKGVTPYWELNKYIEKVLHFNHDKGVVFFLAGDNNPQIFWAYHYTVNSGLRMPAWEMEKHEYCNKDGSGAIKTGKLSRLIWFFMRPHQVSCNIPPVLFVLYQTNSKTHLPCERSILSYFIA